MNTMIASQEWSTRPNDQRFWNLNELHAAVSAHKSNAYILDDINYSDLRAEVFDGELKLVGPKRNPVHLTHWAFGQLAQRASAPASYLRTLPPTLAAQNINHGLKANVSKNAASLLLDLETDGNHVTDMTARAIQTSAYGRIWNADVVERLRKYADVQGWDVPPAYVPYNSSLGEMRTRKATAADAALSLTIHEGDTIAPAGLYASFEDMFIFMVRPDRVIRDGSPSGLMRGFIIKNSEVGKYRWELYQFLFRGVCGNHIIWGLESGNSIKLVHRGDRAEVRAFDGMGSRLAKYADESALDVESRIQSAQTRRIASDRTSVIAKVHNKGLMTVKAAEASYDAIQPDIDGDPLSFWGFAQGITRVSQNEPNADTRESLDRAAGKLLDFAF